MVYDHVFDGAKTVDIKIAKKGTIQRRYGVQSLLFVNKQLRDETTRIFYQKCTFEIPHFKLHAKHRRENPMTGLEKIFKLEVLWTPPPRRTFSTTKGDYELLKNLPKLKRLTLNLLNMNCIRIGADLSEPERHEAMIGKLGNLIKSLPPWIVRTLKGFSSRPMFKLFLFVYFKEGEPIVGQEYHMTVGLHSCWRASHNN